MDKAKVCTRKCFKNGRIANSRQRTRPLGSKAYRYSDRSLVISSMTCGFGPKTHRAHTACISHPSVRDPVSLQMSQRCWLICALQRSLIRQCTKSRKSKQWHNKLGGCPSGVLGLRHRLATQLRNAFRYPENQVVATSKFSGMSDSGQEEVVPHILNGSQSIFR